jgi:glycosyltransferase involved in cell wall biosynthesis
VRLRLAGWTASGARLAAPARSAARALEEALGLVRGTVIDVPLPHPAADSLPQGEPPFSPPALVAVRPPYEVLLPAVRALWALTPDRPFTAIAANDAKPYVDPGGLAQLHGLMGPLDVGAVADWRDALFASVIVWFPAELDAGHELREALATGRPVVAPHSAIVRDHLRACGAPAYTFAGLHDPVGLAAALHAALADGGRRRVGECAAAAVRAESWESSALRIVDAVAPRPARSVPRARARGERLAVALIDAQGSDGGGERLLTEIVEGLCRHPSDPDVRLVCVDDPDVNFSPPLRRARELGATVIGVPREAAQERAGAALADADAGWQIWAQTTEPFDSPTPVVATIHDLAPVRFDVIGGTDPATAERIVRGWIATADAMTCSSHFIRGDIEDLIPEAAGRFTVIPLAAPRADAVPSPERLADVRRRYALPPKFLLSPAPRARHKNYALLVSALDRLRQAGSPVTVVATGSGTDHAYWGPDLIGLGYVPAADLGAIRALAGGVVQTTLYEAGSFPVFEAMLAGLPVACSNIPPLVEQLERDSAYAELFDPADPDQLAQALTAIWQPSPHAVRSFYENAERVGRRTWIDVAGDYLALLGEVARAGSGSRTSARLTLAPSPPGVEQ